MRTRICAVAGCYNTTKDNNKYCDKHINTVERKIFTVRTKSRQWHNKYNNAQWRKKSREFLRNNPYCVECGNKATITDHIIPHRGNEFLFWSDENLQAMCQSCHTRKTFAENKNFNR